MNRRDLMKTGAAGLAASMMNAHVAHAAEEKSYRVGLIGSKRKVISRHAGLLPTLSGSHR